MTLQVNENQFKSMLELQAGFNAKLLPTWRTEPPRYTDAIWTEAAEAFDYTGWPWWKKAGQSPDYGQMKMELIDIWHFLISELMLHEEQENVTYFDLAVSITAEVNKMEEEFGTKDEDGPNINFVREAFRNIVRAALLPATPERIVTLMSTFLQGMLALHMSWEEVYKLYVGKNTLNMFRQNNGYKSDTDEYKARWANEKGWEDNQYLTELLKTLDATKKLEVFQYDILQALTTEFYKSSNFKK